MRTTEVLEELRRLPLRPTAVTRVLAILDHPSASAEDVATALQADPSLTARLLQLANSAYFGLSGKIGSVERAVVALGRSVIRSLAVSTAAGLFGDDHAMPDGFWSHSVAVAAGTSIAARQAGIVVGDALCAGLLHDLGTALLFRFDPDGYDELLETVRDPRLLAPNEVYTFGGDHAMIGAFALEQWHLPDPILDALRYHHSAPLDVGDKLGRTVIAGEAMARAAFEDPPFTHEPAADPAEA
ncbi:MAG TPA: HDOD domain-containing protein, partial [Acidimicrobiia bacterium]|nr:HDOD domain-containing protein [Acidimicrobiia bacterium]